MKILSDNILNSLTRPALIKTIKELQETISNINGNNQNLYGENNVLKIREMNLQKRIDEAIEKLYCWGEVLDADFQKEMLDILQGNKEEE